MFNQWSGINSLAYFLPITFGKIRRSDLQAMRSSIHITDIRNTERNIGLSRELSLILAGVLGVQYFLVSWLPYFFMDRLVFNHYRSIDPH